MIYSHILLTVGWLLYCVLHSVLADERVKVKIIQAIGIQVGFYRICYNIFALFSLVALLWYHFALPSPALFHSASLSKYLGPLIVLIGITGMLACIFKYFRQLSGLQKLKEKSQQPVLETTGMHQYVRHPLYISTFVFLVGLFLMSPLLSNLIAVVIIIVYTIMGIRFEENKLIKEFGEAYLEYKRKVPMLIPWRRG